MAYSQAQLNAKLEARVQDYVSSRAKSFMTILNALNSREIEDMVVPSQFLNFVGQTGLSAQVKEKSTVHEFALTPHSAQQIANRVGLPVGWVRNSAETDFDYYRDAVAYALNQYVQHAERADERFLFRNVNGTTRGILSTAYKRLNTKEIFTAFLGAAQKMGLTLMGAYEGWSKDFIEVLDPTIRWIDTPNNGRVGYCRGFQLKNSDFGDGALLGRSLNLQAICCNGLIGNRYLKEVHLGKRMSDEHIFSIDTINMETELRARKVVETLAYVFNPMNTEIEEAQVIDASGKIIEIQPEVERLPKIGFTVNEAKAVGAVLMNNDKNDGVEGKPTVWKLSQAISRVAQDAEPERQRTMMEIAGDMVFKQVAELTSVEIE